MVESQGLKIARSSKGFHDEPLRGERKGQRSIRLNIQWRAIYETKIEYGVEKIELVEVIEVTPHKY